MTVDLDAGGCSVEGCLRPRKARGMCELHYARVRRTGQVDLPDRSAPARFWSKVDKTESCWNWTGYRLRGYGQFGDVGTHVVLAHRWSFEQANGPIPEGLVIDHLCRNPRCVNPAHLEAVTNRTNVVRGLAPAVNSNQDTCRKGLHPWPESAVKVGGKWPQLTCRLCRKERQKKWKKQ